MQVLHVTRDFPPRSTGGLSTAVGGLTRALQRAGVSCSVLSFDGWRPRASTGSRTAGTATETAGIPVRRIRRGEQLDVAKAIAAASAPALIHVHDAMLSDETRALRAALERPAVYGLHVLHSKQDAMRDATRPSRSAEAEGRALAEACSALLADPQRAETIGRAAATATAQRHLWSHAVSALTDVCRAIL